MGLNLKPLADRVVVAPAPAEDKSAGGIILPVRHKKSHSKDWLLLLDQVR